MKLILTRHGVTRENKKGIIQGRKYGALSYDGLEQNRLLAKRLSKEKIDIIYTSKVKRALQTAEEVASFHKARLITSEKLNPRAFDDFEGLSYSLFDKEAIANNTPNYLFKVSENAENYIDVEERVLDFLNEIKYKHFNENVLVVGHNTPNKVLIAHMLGMPLEKTSSLSNKNASINIFEYDGEDFKMKILNDCSHLETE